MLTMTVLDVFLHAREKQVIPHHAFWQHCIACAVAARTLARRKRICPHEEAFVAGLLHDLGKVVLAMVIPAQYREVVRLAEEGGLLLCEAEQELLGLTHAAVGGWAAEKWRLPATLVSAVDGHHEPSPQGVAAGLVHCVSLANYVVNAHAFGWSGNGRSQELSLDVVSAAGLDPLDLEMLPEEMSEDFLAACQLLEVS